MPKLGKHRGSKRLHLNSPVMPEEAFKLTKLDAARRQLHVALEMWFSEADPVAAHTLINAAHRLLLDLHEARGGLDPLKLVIKPEHQAEVRRLSRKAANFLKHADEDPSSELEFNPEINGLQLLQCLQVLRMLGETMTATELAFWERFGLENPELLVPETQGAAHAAARKVANDISRREFLEGFRLARKALEVDKAWRTARGVGA
jgi:hypothetical protein